MGSNWPALFARYSALRRRWSCIHRFDSAGFEVRVKVLGAEPRKPPYEMARDAAFSPKALDVILGCAEVFRSSSPVEKTRKRGGDDFGMPTLFPVSGLGDIG